MRSVTLSKDFFNYLPYLLQISGFLVHLVKPGLIFPIVSPREKKKFFVEAIQLDLIMNG